MSLEKLTTPPFTAALLRRPTRRLKQAVEHQAPSRAHLHVTTQRLLHSKSGFQSLTPAYK